jgi:murein L,D-transpeptidase YafK
MLALLLSLAQAADPVPIEAITLHAAVEKAGLTLPLKGVRLVLDKSDRRLELWSGKTFVKAYLVGLGTAPEGDKVRQGDRKTPDGDFHIVNRNDKSSFHLFLGISYPNTEDADRGLAAGLVTAEEAQLIREADTAVRVPPWNTDLGGKIGIHGGGAGVDWTWGCIAVEDFEVDELWEVVRVGTPLHIDE